MRTNNEKTLSTGASPVVRSAEHVYQAVRTVDMVNLRPGDDCSLRPVGMPKTFASLGEGVPLGVMDGCLLAARGTAVAAAPLDAGSATAPVISGRLPSAPLCTLDCGDDGILVMTDEGPVSIGAAGSRSAVRPTGFDFPPLTLTPSAWGKVTATVAARTLSQAYNTSTTLVARDVAAVTGDLAAAYLRMCADAAAVGGMLQPVIARYKLRDSRGNILFTSAPVLLGHSSGAQLANYVGLKSDDRMTLKAYSLEAGLWSLSIRFPDASAYADAARVASAEIWFTPMFHPYHPDMHGTVVIARASAADDDFLRVTLPGMNCGLGEGRPGNVERLLMKALAHIDEIEERVAVIAAPFDGGERTVAVALSPDPDAASVSRRLGRALAKAVQPCTPAAVLLGAPHTFSAACCAADASVAVWGNLTVRRYAGYPLQTLAVSCRDEPWSATTVVRFSDGTGVSRSESGSTGAPVAFSPLLSYPSPDAVEMKIIVTSGGSTRTHTVSLIPDTTCRVSAFCGAGAKHLSLVGSSGVSVPALPAPSDRFADFLAFAPAGAPLAVDAVIGTGGAVNALVPRVSPDQSWEFGRARFLAGTDKGVFAVAVAPGRTSLSVRRLAEGTVRRPDAMVAAASGDAFVLCGTGTGTGPALLRIPASGRAVVFEVPRNYCCLAWNSILGELWAVRDDGRADIFCVAHGWRRYSRDDVSVRSVYHLSGEPFGVGPRGLMRLGCEEAVPRQRITLDFLVNPAGLRPVRPGRLRAMLCCSSVFGVLTLEGRNLAGALPWPLLSATLDGACLSPLSMLPAGRPLRRMEVRLEADVSSDFVFESFRIGYYDCGITSAA